MNTITSLYNKIGKLEEEVQRLKVDAFLSLPKKIQRSYYPEKEIINAAKETRTSIWKKRYNRQIARIH